MAAIRVTKASTVKNIKRQFTEEPRGVKLNYFGEDLIIFNLSHHYKTFFA